MSRSAPRSRRAVVSSTLIVFGLAGALVLAAGIAIGGERSSGSVTPSTGHPGSTSADASSQKSADVLAKAITVAQQRLRANPKDWSTWAQLGAAYVQEGRITVDPSYYPKAEGALNKSFALNSDDNYQALIGLGALANARHDFTAALAYGQRARAIDAYSSSAYGVINDAYTQLGDYTKARDAVQHMLDLRPGVSAFTRASYDFEERGARTEARRALQRALADAFTPADVAYCRYYLGELAFNAGDLNEAARQYDAGLAADRGYDPLTEGKAKVEAARGQSAAALRDYATVIARVPQPQYILELGELQQSLGQHSAAATSYQLLATEQRLFAANGVVDDLLPAQVDADHGDPVVALRHARAEWSKRHSVLVADALGWALHVNHHDTAALAYARIAVRTGWRNAVFAYHRGVIEASVGQRTAARADLKRALAINPFFSPLQAPLARAALHKLAISV